MALLQSSVTEDDIITIRTVQGYEIVAKFVSETSASILVNKPKLVSGSSSIADLGTTKVLWSNLGVTFGTLANVEINSTNILMADLTEEDIADQYTAAVA
jgi:hypothetical protein